jgi:hypothetical protein
MVTTTSTWSALRNPSFRTLWSASLVSGTCVAAHDTATQRHSGDMGDEYAAELTNLDLTEM